MGLCRDKATNYLAQLGYSVVRIPRENINPLDLVGRDRDQMKLGTLDQLITNPRELPAITRNQKSSEVSGQASSTMKLGIGLSVLGNVLGALAGTSLGVDAAYENARTIQFEFRDVLYDSVNPLTVGQYLRAVDIDVGNPVLDRYIMGPGQLFVLTETLKASAITVKAERSSSGSAAVNVPVLNGVAGGKLTIDASKAENGEVTYAGTTPVVFGFKCFRIIVNDGSLDVEAAAPNDVALAAGVSAMPEELVLGTGLIDLSPGDLRA